MQEQTIDVVVRVTVTYEKDENGMAEDYAIDLVKQCLDGLGWSLTDQYGLSTQLVEITSTSGGFDEVYNSEDEENWPA
jgi:hypothetical protein